MVHGEKELQSAKEASAILFGQDTHDALMKMEEKMVESVMEGVPHFSVSKEELSSSPLLVDFLTEKAPVFNSKGELRKLIRNGGVSLNKQKVSDEQQTLSQDELIAGRYILIQRGKKNYYLLVAE